MKKYRTSLILLGVLAILAAFLILRNQNNTFRSKENVFAIDDTTNITRFFLADKNNNSVTLSRQADGNWLLNKKYEVNPTMISVMLETFSSIEPKAPVAKTARNTIIRLMAGKSIKTEIYQRVYRIDFAGIHLFPHEKMTRVYYVGDPTMDNSGTFMLMEGSEEPYIVGIPGFRGFVATRYSAMEGDWRSHTVFRTRVPEISSLSVSFSDKPENSFRITHTGDRDFSLFSLADNRNIDSFDTLKVVEYLSKFRNLNYERLLDNMPKVKRDSIVANVPTNVITLVDKMGKTHSLKTWKRKADFGQLDLNGNQAEYDLERMYGQIDDNEMLVTIQYFVFTDVLPPLMWFTLKSSGPGTN
jgi:hypothetical protein